MVVSTTTGSTDGMVHHNNGDIMMVSPSNQAASTRPAASNAEWNAAGRRSLQLGLLALPLRVDKRNETREWNHLPQRYAHRLPRLLHFHLCAIWIARLSNMTVAPSN